MNMNTAATITLSTEKLTMSETIFATKNNTQRDYERLHSLYYEDNPVRKSKGRVIRCKYGCVDMLFDSKAEHTFHVNRMHLHPMPFLRIMLSHIAWNEVGKMTNREIATMVGEYLCSLAECKDKKTSAVVIDALTEEVEDLALSTQEVQSAVACSIISALCKKKKAPIATTTTDDTTPDGKTTTKTTTTTRKRTRNRVVDKKKTEDDELITNASSIIERMQPSSALYHLTSGSSDNEDEQDKNNELKPIKMPTVICPPISPNPSSVATSIASSDDDEEDEERKIDLPTPTV